MICPGASESPPDIKVLPGGKTLGEDKINAGLLISSVVEFAPQLLGLLHAKSIDFVLVNAHELPIPVEHLAVDDGGAAVLAFHAEEPCASTSRGRRG